MKKTRATRTGRSKSYPRLGSLARALGALTVGAGAMIGVPQAQATEECVGEAAAFEAAITAGTPAALDKFLEKYPDCALTAQAFALLNDLDPAAGTPEPDDDPEREAGRDHPGGQESGSGYDG